MCIGMCISIPHFGTNFGTTRTMYYLDTSLGATLSTISVDQVDLFSLCGMYLTISLGTSPAPQGHLYIYCCHIVCSCVVA